MSMVLSTKALTGYRDYTKRVLSYAKYRIGSTYHKIPIDEIKIISSNRMVIYLTLNPDVSQEVIIKEVQIYDTDNEIWLSASENLPLKPVQEGLLYSFEIEFKEVQKQ